MALGWGGTEEDGAYLLFPKSRVEMRGGSRGRGGDKTFSICATKTFSSRREDIGSGKGGPPVFFFYEVTFANVPTCKVQNPLPGITCNSGHVTGCRCSGEEIPLPLILSLSISVAA